MTLGFWAAFPSMIGACAPFGTTPAGPEDPDDQAREVVDAMRAGGTLTPEVEAALMGGARRHARFVATKIAEPDSHGG